MAITTIKGFHGFTIEIAGSDNILTVARYATVRVSSGQWGIHTEFNSTNNQIIVNGRVSVVDKTQAEAEAIWLESDNSSIAIGAHGEVSAQNGIRTLADNISVQNAGTVTGTEGGVGRGIMGWGGLGGVPTGLSIENSGTISASYALDTYAYSTLIRNLHSGRIVSDYAAIFISGGDAQIVNHGLVKGDTWGVYAWDQHDNSISLRNDGTIIGDVGLSAFDDILDNRGGTIKGEIFGGDGDDTLITDDAMVTLTEKASEGWDWIKSTVSYTLTKNVEQLNLLGKRNINGTGSGDAGTDNYLYGNAGDNMLKGWAGYNELFGRGGTDTLLGSKDVDLFGIGQDYGHDTVKGFKDGVDQIDIYLLGPNEFTELQSHIEKHGADTWLDFGNDVLILKNVNPSVLDAGDFIFNY